MPRITVGVDAGGTETVAAFAKDGAAVRIHRGPAANATSVGAAEAARRMLETIVELLDATAPNAIFVGAAGAGRASTAAAIAEHLRKRFPDAVVKVADDACIALRAAVPQGDGAALIAGTGVIAYAEREGTAYRAGGYGHLFGDEGSAFAIGSAAIKSCLRVFDGRARPDELSDAAAKRLGAQSTADVLGAIYADKNPAAAVASFAPLVLELANGGQRSAQKIVQGAALELSELAKTIVARAELPAQAPLAFAGGLLRQNSLLTYLLETRLQNELPATPIVRSAVEPCFGALAAAGKLLP